jgi:hypothetical protein
MSPNQGRWLESEKAPVWALLGSGALVEYSVYLPLVLRDY